MASTINAKSTGSGSLESTADASGVLALQTGGVTAMTIDTSQNVGIGTTSPNTIFDINNAVPRVSLSVGGSLKAQMNVAGSAYNLTCNDATFPMTFNTGGGERMRIDSSGRVTTPFQPAFFVTKTTQTNLTATDSVIIYDSSITNIGSCYNVSNGRFTAPIAGFYQFNIVNTLYSSSGSTYNAVYPWINGSGTGVYSSIRSRGAMINGNYSGVNGSFSMYLNASDYIQLYVYAQNTSYFVAGEQIFSGYLIG